MTPRKGFVQFLKVPNVSDPLKQIHLHAGGIDAHAKEHYIAVPVGARQRTSSIRRRICLRSCASRRDTCDLEALASWLLKCGVTTVAVQATGVCHLPLVEVLQQRGIEVIIVDPRQTTHAPGRPKTDVLECQWIQRLHAYGLLRASFVPGPEIRKLRAYERQRDMLLCYAAAHVQHMQKALELMNCKLTETIKDVVGVTGMLIIKAIARGVRDPQKLASYRQCNCKATAAESRPPCKSTDPQEMAQNAYYFETSDDDPQTGLGRRVVRLGTVPVGSLLVRGETTPLTNNAIASLIAITFDRYRAFANESRIETERRTEQLRATVLDSLAHAYKTPLTAIRAASTGLGEMGHLSAGQADLVALIDEQSGLLNDLTNRLLTTARLDAGEVTIHATPVGVGSLIDEVVDSLRDRLASMKVSVDLKDDNLVVCCDRQLMVMLLTQYIDNACKYSIFGTMITIRVVHVNAEAIFSVHSYGPVIPIEDRERIFNRYYRSSTQSNRASGTGIGLSVAKRAALIHGGYVWVTSEENEGTTFYAAIPAPMAKRSS